MSLLAPLAARYLTSLPRPARQTRPDGDAVEEDPAEVRAMPVVLRIDRGAPPSRTGLLEATATAALAVCLDERSEPGGEWHDEVAAWVAGRIRKVTRRARGAHWEAVRELPGVSVSVDGAQVRALLPCLVTQTPRVVSRLQISGTDLPFDSPGPPADGLPVIWLDPGLQLSVGKAAAQVGHATMLLAASLPDDQLAAWRVDGLHCSVRIADPSRWPRLRADADGGRGVAVRDAGFTEVAPGTTTCVATWRP